MPAFVSHVLFGEMVCQCLPEEPRLLAQAHPAAFYWGLQGPDLLFFRDAVRGKSPLPAIGGRMHREKTAQLLETMAKYIRLRKKQAKGDDELLEAYFMGFLCHYVLDSCAHPYIYYLQERRKLRTEKKAWGGLHNQIESQIDSALYRRIKGGEVSGYRIPKAYRDRLTELSVSRLYRQVLWHVYGIQVDSFQVAKAFDDCHRLMGLLVRGRLLPAVEAGERLLLGKENAFSAHIRPLQEPGDVLNLDRGLWAPLNDPDHGKNQSFPELMEEALELAVEGICAWGQGIASGVLPDWRGCENFDNGCPQEA